MSKLMTLAEELQGLLYRSFRLLDEERFEEWLADFTDDATYYVNSRANMAFAQAHGGTDDDVVALVSGRQQNGLPLRVQWIREIWYASQLRAHTLHLITNVEVESLSDNEALVRSAFVIYVTRGSEQMVFPGRYEDRFRRVEGNRWKICRRKAVLENDIVRGPLIFIV